MIALTAGEIHLWLVFYDEINDGELHCAYRALLNDAEKQQELRFYFAKDRRRYLVTRALVRTMLSRYVSIAPRDLLFSTNKYGRPHVVNVAAQDARLSFSISHTHSLIVLGVTQDRAVGVDVENIRGRQASIDIAERFFAPEEAAALATIPHHQQQDRFFEYWTLKESYIKARGMGLSIPLDKFSFHFPHPRRVEISIRPELADTAHWQFWQFQPTPEYLIAVCAEHLGAECPRLLVNKVVPAVIESALATVLLRTSQ